MRRAALALLLLAGCASMQWMKPAASPEQMQKDSAECRDAAWREASRYSWYPYAPWYFPPYGYGYAPRAHFYPGPGGYYNDRFYEEERLTQFCMHSRGYQLVPAERSAAE